MSAKDFNKLVLFGQKYDKNSLINEANKSASHSEWESDFWAFILQWLNDKSYIQVQTSGSTGKPKEIKLAKDKMLVSARNTCKHLNLKATHKALLCITPRHIGGMMMIVRAFFAGYDLHFVKPEANPLSKLNSPIDFIALVPYQVHKILDTNVSQLQSIQHIIIGGGKIDFSLEQKIKEHKISAYSTFGMTETISHIALKKIGNEDYYTCLPGTEISLSDEGTLTIHSPDLLDVPLETNDLIEFISKNQFRWLGRADFAIESGGLKIVPEVIEAKLASKISHPFIISSIPHPTLGQELILILASNEEIELPKDVFQSLGKYEKAKKVFFLDALSYTKSGKVDRLETRKRIL